MIIDPVLDYPIDLRRFYDNLYIYSEEQNRGKCKDEEIKLYYTGNKNLMVEILSEEFTFSESEKDKGLGDKNLTPQQKRLHVCNEDVL